MVPNYFCIDSNSIMSSVFIASFNNLLMILESIYRFNKFNSFSHLYRAVSWYARVDIFNSLIRYLSPTDWHCCDINFFINLLSKTKSYLALFLSFLIFCFGVQFFFYLSIFHLLFFYQNRFSSHTSNETSFLVSLHCLSVKIFFKLFSKLSIFFTK